MKLGKVQVDKKNRIITFPATLNLQAGIIEYLLVTTSGKIHESLLRTDIEPFQLHAAMLLLGAKGAGTNAFPEDPTKPIPGDPIGIELSWREGRGTVRKPADQFIYNARAQSSMTAGPWTYTGSQMWEGTFIAQQDGSIVAIFLDPDALVNNPRPGHENDEIWLVNTNGLPPLNVEITVTFKPLFQTADE